MAGIDGATLIARSLKQQGVEHMFGIVGFPVIPVAFAAQREGVSKREKQSLCRAAGCECPNEFGKLNIVANCHPNAPTVQCDNI